MAGSNSAKSVQEAVGVFDDAQSLEAAIDAPVAFDQADTARQEASARPRSSVYPSFRRRQALASPLAPESVILVGPRNGIATQTRRHSFIASLLGIRNVVLAINKIDLLPYLSFDIALLKNNALKINPNLKFFALSATTPLRG